MRAMVLVMIGAFGCTSPRVTIDAGVVVDAPVVDFFGEACEETIYMDAPILTFCHGGDGACVDGVCRPWCSSIKDSHGEATCLAGTREITDRHACVCVP